MQKDKQFFKEFQRPLILIGIIVLFDIILNWILYLNDLWAYADYVLDFFPAAIILIAGIYELIYKKSLTTFAEILDYKVIVIAILSLAIIAFTGILLGSGWFVLTFSVGVFWLLMILFMKIYLRFSKNHRR